jgi:hypothetical protein
VLSAIATAHADRNRSKADQMTNDLFSDFIGKSIGTAPDSIDRDRQLDLIEIKSFRVYDGVLTILFDTYPYDTNQLKSQDYQLTKITYHIDSDDLFIFIDKHNGGMSVKDVLLTRNDAKLLSAIIAIVSPESKYVKSSPTSIYKIYK